MKKERKERVAHEVDTVIIEENVASTNYSNEEKETLRNFAINFNEILHSQNVKQEEFCEKVGISTGALSSYRNGKRFPESRILSTISKELNVSLDYLFGLSKIKKPDDDFKIINHTTGLTDDAIKNLKEYNDFINDPNSTKELKNSIKNKLKAINYLIAKEEESFIFSTISSFLWFDYDTNYEDVLYKGINKNSIYKPNLDEDKKIYGNEILLKVKNQNITRGIKKEDINKLDFILIEEQLSILKEQFKKEEN